MIQILMLLLSCASLPVLIVKGNMQKIMQNIIELPYSPQMIIMLELNVRNLLAVIVSPLGQITPQMTKVTNQNLKV